MIPTKFRKGVQKPNDETIEAIKFKELDKAHEIPVHVRELH